MQVGLVAPRSRPRPARQLFRIRQGVVAEPPAARRQGPFADRRVARHHDQHREPLLPVDRLSGQPEPAGRLRQAADLHDLRQHARPDAALQPSRGVGEGEPPTAPSTRRRSCSTARTSSNTRPRLQPVRRRGARQLRGVPGRQAVRRGRRRHPQARSAIRPRRFPARLAGADAAGRHHLRISRKADRRDFGRLSDAQVRGSRSARP